MVEFSSLFADFEAAEGGRGGGGFKGGGGLWGGGGGVGRERKITLSPFCQV